MAQQPPLTREDLKRYFAHIGLDLTKIDASEAGSLTFLERLMKRHLCAVPFENLQWHFFGLAKKPSHLLGPPPSLLGPPPTYRDDTFRRIIDRNLGGTHAELNLLFARILRALGYVVTVVGGDVLPDRNIQMPDDKYREMNRLLLIIVTIDGTRYLVDVGFGANLPCRPLPLVSDAITRGVGSQEFKLNRTYVIRSVRKAGWVYYHREHTGIEWIPGYAFWERDVLSAEQVDRVRLAGMYPELSILGFARYVICTRFVYDADKDAIAGRLTLFDDTLSRSFYNERWSHHLATEEEKADVLEIYFGILLTKRQTTCYLRQDRRYETWRNPDWAFRGIPNPPANRPPNPPPNTTAAEAAHVAQA